MANGTAKKASRNKTERMNPGDAQKAFKLWNALSKAVDNGSEVLLRDRGGQNTVVDIQNP